MSPSRLATESVMFFSYVFPLMAPGSCPPCPASMTTVLSSTICLFCANDVELKARKHIMAVSSMVEIGFFISGSKVNKTSV